MSALPTGDEHPGRRFGRDLGAARLPRSVRRLGTACLAGACVVTVLAGGAIPASGASTLSARPAAAAPKPAPPQPPPPVAVGNPKSSSSAQVTYTPNTIAISPALVRSSLVGVSPDGSTFTFSTAAGPFAKLAPNKVILLEGFDAGVVTSVSHVGGKLVVATTPASLTQVIQSGTINVDSPPDYAGAFGTDIDTSPITSPDAAGSASASPRLGGRASPQIAADPALARGFSGTDKTGDLTYKINLAGDSDGLHAYGGFCYSSDGSGNISGTCGGPESLLGQINGVISFQTEAAKVAILKGQPPKGSFSLSGFTAKLDVSYVAKRETGSQIGAKLKAEVLPFAFEMPVCPPPAFCGGVPLYTKFTVSLLVTLGISAKNSVMQGGYTVIVAGSGSVVDQTGFKVIAGSSNGFHLSGKFNPGTSITLGASAAELALQFKVALGVGIRSFNAMFYLAFIPAFGQVTGSLVAGELCENYYANFSITGGIEAQLWIFKIPLVSLTLWSKKETYTQPGC